MELMMLEHRKLWKCKTARISVALCFVYIFVLGGFVSFQWFMFGSEKENSAGGLLSHNFNGYANIRTKQQYAQTWAGPLTDDTLQAMVRDYQIKTQAGTMASQEPTYWLTLNSWMVALWPELKQPDSPYILLKTVNPAQLQDFYSRRQAALESSLDAQSVTQEEKEYFLWQNAQVHTPFSYHWTQGWQFILSGFLGEFSLPFAIFLAVALSPVFSGERHSNTQPLLATTRDGWKKLAGAKVAAVILFALEFYGIMVLSAIRLQLVFFGTAGWDMPIQCVRLLATAPWNVLQAELWEYACLFTATVGFALIVLLCSALARSNYTALLASLAVVFVPMALARFLPQAVQKALRLLPFVGDVTDVLRTNAYSIGGWVIWSPYLLVFMPLLIGLCCIPFAVHAWSKRAQV